MLVTEAEVWPATVTPISMDPIPKGVGNRMWVWLRKLAATVRVKEALNFEVKVMTGIEGQTNESSPKQVP